MRLAFISHLSYPSTTFFSAAPRRSHFSPYRLSTSHQNPHVSYRRYHYVQSNLKSNPDDVNVSPPPPPPPPSSSKTPTVPAAPAEAPKRQLRRRSTKGQSTGMSSFDATIDNMTMKRMGRGTIYYGEKTEAPEPVQPSEDDEFEELKPNSVLVTGATGQTGQWVTLGLLTQNFNVRVMSRKFSKAETLFGPSGSNVDVFEANLSNYNQVKQSVDGSKIIVCCAAASFLSNFSSSLNVVDTKGIEHLVKAAKECGTVEKILYISSNDKKSIKQQKCEQVIVNCGLPYIIIRVNALSDVEGGLYNINLTPITDDGTSTASNSDKISRVDLAQCVCQALVQNRKLSQMALADPDAGFEFPNCIMSVNNTSETFLPDKRFWSNAFNRISDAFEQKTEGPGFSDTSETSANGDPSASTV